MIKKDLINKSKLTTKQEIQDFYEKKLNKIKEQNDYLKKKALDISAPGGYVDTRLTRGVYRFPFATPYAQSLVAEEMANEGYFGLALKQFTSLCRKIKVELIINEDTPKAEHVRAFVERQIKKIGGWDKLFSNCVSPALRWGTGIALPRLEPVGNKVEMFSVSNISMQNIQQFIFDDNDASRLSKIKYLTFNKMTDNGDNSAELITIDVKDNVLAVYSHDAIQGNPFGTFYLYFLYSHYKTYKKITDSIYSSVNAYGSYPVGVKRTSRDSGDDNIDWENAATQRMQELLDAGGGPYIDGEGELYGITPPDTSKMSESMKDIFDIVMRTSSLGQVTAGIDGGGSRNLTESMDNMTHAMVIDTIKSACDSIGDTMIKSLVDINFGRWYLTGQVSEYPKLQIVDETKKVLETIPSGTVEPVIQTKVIEGSKVIDQKDKTTTFTFIKDDANEMEKLIIDTAGLEDILTKATSSLESVLDKTLRDKLKEALTAIANNSKANINPFGMFDKKNFRDSIIRDLQNTVREFAIEQTQYLDNSFKAGNSNIGEQLNQNIIDYANEVADSYIKSKNFNFLVDNVVNQAQNFVRDYATNVSQGFSIDSKEARLEGLNRALKDVDELKGVDIRKIAESSAVKTFTNLSEYESKKVLDKIDSDKYSVIRSGILEGQCEHCRERMGMKYTYTNGKFLNDDGEELKLPDPKCVGMKYGNQCRCFIITIPNNI